MQVTAYAPLYYGRNLRSDLKLDGQVRMVRAARGKSGTGIDHVRGIVERLKALGMNEPVSRSLQDSLGLATWT